MSKSATTLDSKSKHLTSDEIEAMTQAEEECLPDRFDELKKKCPKSLDKAAKKYWKSILDRMEGFGILDSLDAEMLGVYCQMLVRREGLQEMLSADSAQAQSMDAKTYASLESKLQVLERNLLAYAEKLGLTPGGRVALARKKAAQNMEPDTMFGD